MKNKIQIKKILITGGAGYLGSMITTNLVQKGYLVTVVDNLYFKKNFLNHLKNNKNLIFIKDDVLKKKNLKKYIQNQDLIIPLAALVGAPLCDKKKKLAVELNYKTIRYMVGLLKKSQKIIYPNTNSGYGIGKKNKFCNEKSPLNPISLYAKTKVQAEKCVIKHKNSISFRLATVFGVSYRMRSDLLVNNFVATALKDKNLKIFEPNFFRNFIHIKDIVRAFEFSIDNFDKLKNNIYNLGLSTANISKIQLAKKIKKYLPNIKISVIDNFKDPDQRNYIVSNKKIETKGFRAKFSIEEGIIELISYFEKNKNKKIINNY
jgi:nucleoside-diphosphate-sugar epimerase